MHVSPDYENREYLELIVSLDGAYSHIGYFSSGGLTFVGEFYTGRVIDFEFTEKCFKCDDCDKFETNGTCQNGGLFHGDAGQMEIYNAIELFKRSEKWGFQYTTMVADGDNKVFNHIEKRDAHLSLADGVIYPGVIIEKFECANHLQKIAMMSLMNFGVKYEGVEFIPSGAPKPPMAISMKKFQRPFFQN